MSTRIPLAFLVVAIALIATCAVTPSVAGGPITSAQVVAGSVSSPTYSEAWTFSGTNGNRVLIGAVTTGGSMNTVIRLKNPSGTEVINTPSDRVDYQLLATGTYTITIEDSGLNDAGTYNLSLLNLTAGPLSNGSDPDGGGIASAEVKSGQMNQAADFDAFTFSGTAGDRIFFGALATSAAPFNTTITLYPPNGGPSETTTSGADLVDAALGQTGTYTVVIEDLGDNDSGTYSVSFLNITAGPLSNGADADGGTIASAEVKTGTWGTKPDFDAFRFTGTNGNRVLINNIVTAGAPANSVTYLFPPGGGAAVIGTASDRIDYQLQATGTYTIVVADASMDDTGSYALSLLNVTAGPLTNGGDPDGGAIASAEVKTGQMNLAADFDAFTFSGTVGDHIFFGALATSAAPFNTTITLYPPGGGTSEATTSGADLLDIALGQSGTYTVVIEDLGGNDAGTYSVSFLNITAGPLSNGADPDGGTIASAEVKTGTWGTTPDFDAFRFTGTAGNRILINNVLTGGATANTVTYLFPPGGGAAVIGTASDRIDYQLLATGTYTIVVADASMDDTGSYALSLLNVTAGPLSNGSDPDGGSIASSEVKAGQMNLAADFDAFTFNGTMGNRVLLGSVATSAAPFNTTITLYPPNGGPAEVTTSGADLLDSALGESGTYTVVIEDLGGNDTGTYSVSFLNVTTGPFTNGTDPDGGSITSAQVVHGAYSTTPDFDAWQFSGASGNRVLIDAVLTSGGSANTTIYLYPPGGGAALLGTAIDRVDYQLPATGTYTIVSIEASMDEVASYNLSLLNLTAGPLSNGPDPDGGPISSSEAATGQINEAADFDAFTFAGTAGHRVLLGALATSAAPFNTTMTIYPPNGGAAETTTSGADFLDVALAQSGTYTVVIEDLGGNDAGSYSISFMNLTAGPYTNLNDLDGGKLVNTASWAGRISPAPDFDAFPFDGAAGDSVRVSAVTSSGPINTMIYIYPPGGGPAVLGTPIDNVTYVLPTSGTYVLMIADASIDETGTYNLTFRKNGVTSDAPDTAWFDRTRVVLLAPYPNPFHDASSFAFSLPSEMPVQLRVYDASGALVRTVAGETLPAGPHLRAWDGRNGRGEEMAGGVYYLRFEAGAKVETRKLTRIR